MKRATWIVAGALLAVVCVTAWQARAFNDIMGDGLGGTATEDGFMAGYRLCFDGDGTAWCIVLDGTGLDFDYGSVTKVTIANDGAATFGAGLGATSGTFSTTLDVTGVTSLALLDTSDGATLGAEVHVAGDLTMTAGGSILTTANGDLTLAAHGSGDLIIDGTSGKIDSRDIYQGGDGTYSWTACAAAGSVCTEGNLEVDSAARFDGTVSFQNSVTLGDNRSIGAPANNGTIIFTNTYQTPDASSIIPGSLSNVFIVNTWANREQDYAIPQQTNPTLVFTSAAAASVVTDRRAFLAHDVTTDDAGDFTISTGAGGIVLAPDSDIVYLDGDSLCLGTDDSGFCSGLESSTVLEWAYDATSLMSLSSVGNLAIAGDLTVAAYDVTFTIPPNRAVLGPTAPDSELCGSYACIGFDADAEAVYLTQEIADCLVGTTGTLSIYWTNQAADLIQQDETVKWDISYRSKLWATGEAYDAGGASTGTVTYTEAANPGVDKDMHLSTIALTGLAAGQVLGIQFDRDIGVDDYTGEARVAQWEITYSCNAIPNHH